MILFVSFECFGVCKGRGGGCSVDKNCRQTSSKVIKVITCKRLIHPSVFHAFMTLQNMNTNEYQNSCKKSSALNISPYKEKNVQELILI